MRKQRLITIGLLLLLAASFALNVALVLGLRRAYGEQLLHQIWPAGGAMPRASTNETGATILLLGDSRVADWPESHWPAMRVVNAGVPGQTSAELLRHCPSTLDQVRPKIVVIQIGINDLKAIGVYPELQRAIGSTCVSNIIAVIEECRRRDARVLVTAVWPAGSVGGVRRLIWNDGVAEAIAETNRALEQSLPNRPGVRWADPYSAIASRPPAAGMASLYRDTLHFKPEFYARMSPLLQRMLESWIPPAP